MRKITSDRSPDLVAIDDQPPAGYIATRLSDDLNLNEKRPSSVPEIVSFVAAPNGSPVIRPLTLDNPESYTVTRSS